MARGKRRLVLGGTCYAGHELTEDNLVQAGGRSRCRECQLGYQREHSARRHEGKVYERIERAELAELREKAWMYDELRA